MELLVIRMLTSLALQERFRRISGVGLEIKTSNLLQGTKKQPWKVHSDRLSGMDRRIAFPKFKSTDIRSHRYNFALLHWRISRVGLEIKTSNLLQGTRKQPWKVHSDRVTVRKIAERFCRIFVKEARISIKGASRALVVKARLLVLRFYSASRVLYHMVRDVLILGTPMRT
ncbi:hypothetical protein Tcan_04606 [Toxocara canis]|uniref:Uncharacterized protein n=1 Tax=Toxocara canis TaxID=6265 RepID=A0A0B2W232_TOXCA|nr:hypothetical protein Tcan_04606 [Toxocara canis]